MGTVQYISAKNLNKLVKNSIRIGENRRAPTATETKKILSHITGGSKGQVSYAVKKMAGGATSDMKVKASSVHEFLKDLNKKIIRDPQLQKKFGLKEIHYAAGKPKYYETQFKKIKAEQKKMEEKKGPSPEELEAKKVFEIRNKRRRQREAEIQVYGPEANVLQVARGETEKPMEKTSVSSSPKGTDNVVPFERGTSLPQSKGIDAGTSFVGTFGQDDNDQEDTSANVPANKVTDINEFRKKKEDNKNVKKDEKDMEDPDHFGKDINDLGEAA